MLTDLLLKNEAKETTEETVEIKEDVESGGEEDARD
jgi:hypothetical protein